MRKALLSICAAMLSLSAMAHTSNTPSEASGSTTVQYITDNSRKNDTGLYAEYDRIWKRRSKFINIGYVFQTLTFPELGDMTWKSDLGVSFSSGQTYYLHKKPIAGMMKFGLDVTWFDVNYVKYSGNVSGLNAPSDSEMDFSLGLHQADIALQLGPSFTINPIDHLKVAVYFRYMPTLSFVILDNEFGYNYVSFFNAGLSVSYKVISIGFENRWGTATYNNISANSIDEDMDNLGDLANSFRRKLKTNSMRLYISFRF